MAVIKVVLVEDHALLRQGLRALLEYADDIQVMGDTDSGEGVLALIHQGLRPDVVVMGMRLRGMSGVEATQRLKHVLPTLQVIGLSVQESEAAALAMRRAGAFDALGKAADVTALVNLVRAAYRDTLPTTSATGAEGQPEGRCQAQRGGDPRLPHKLTHRELEVVRALLQGQSNKEIAHHLILSERTVRTHLRNIFAKLQVTSRTKLVLAAIHHGWGSPVTATEAGWDADQERMASPAHL
jgi:DNA-binding NarL/FixJ family response regulator